MELDDGEIEQIAENGNEAGHNDSYFGQTLNPYPTGTEESDIWDCAYRNGYARENGK